MGINACQCDVVAQFSYHHHHLFCQSEAQTTASKDAIVAGQQGSELH